MSITQTVYLLDILHRFGASLISMSTKNSSREIDKRFGQLLAKRRKRAGISQERLADILGLTRTSVTNIEQGRQPVQLHTLFTIADALGIEPTDLMPTAPELSSQSPIELEQFKSLSAKTSRWLVNLASDVDDK
jgi:transcriptional regulator with XRE-family HTH domain